MSIVNQHRARRKTQVKNLGKGFAIERVYTSKQVNTRMTK
jgi:hypothetical protein